MEALASVLLGLLTNALWELGSDIVRRASEPEPTSAIQEALDRAQDALRLTVPDDLVAIATEALNSPETRSIVRALYLQRLSDKGGSPKVAALAFRQIWEANGGPSSNDVPDRVFDVLLRACDETIDAAIADGNLSALDAKAAIRFKLLSEQLQALELRITLLQDDGTLSRVRVTEFERAVREEVRTRTATVTPPDFYGAPRVPLADIYVAPNLSARDGSGEETSSKYGDWLAALRSSVVLGNPGAGKSTLATKVCNDVAAGHGSGLVGGRDLTPYIVLLRDYAAAKKDRPISIAHYIAQTINTNLQLAREPAIVEYLLLAGRLMVVFDGLDELLDTSYRQEIRDDVESFARRYPNVPLLVTSREVGYDFAPLAADRFARFRLEAFEVDQVRAYARHWFGRDADLAPAERERKAEAFVAESNIVADLRSNPLMLALMCNFYTGQNYIPRNRPDVYEKCSLMLFDTWDRQRDIKQDLGIREHIEPAMHDLAHWIYNDPTRQGGVTEAALVAQAAIFLQKWRFEDPFVAKRAASEFVEFCRGRAWVFTDTGSTAEGEPLYQFTHRTFLEYFTARYFVAANPDPRELARNLLPAVARGAPDLVAQLACQIAARAVLGGADMIVVESLSMASKAGETDQVRVLTFASRCLRFLVPTPAIVRQLTTAVVTALLSVRYFAADDSANSDRDISEELSVALGAVMTASSENRTPATQTIVEVLERGVLEGREEAAELAYNLTRPIGRWGPDEIEADGKLVEYWDGQSRALRKGCAEALQEITSGNVGLAIDACACGELTIERFVDLHGVTGLIIPRAFVIWRGSTTPSLAERAYKALSETTPDAVVMGWYAPLAAILVSADRPWIDVGEQDIQTVIRGLRRLERPSLSLFVLRISWRSTRFPSADARFVVFCLLALRVEVNAIVEMRRAGLISGILGRTWPSADRLWHAVEADNGLEELAPVLRARIDGASDRLDAQIQALELSESQTELVRLWVTGATSLISLQKPPIVGSPRQ